MFRNATYEEFERAIAESGASPLFFETFSGFVSINDWDRDKVAICDGPLRIDGSLNLDAGTTLVLGDLDVSDTLDIDLGGDIGGTFIVIGNVRCRHLIGAERSMIVIDGDLTAETVLTGYEDSATSVIGTLRARLFIGADVWIETGAGAVIDYGCGYCLPIGWRDAEAQSIRPRHDEAATARAVRVAQNPEGYAFQPDAFAERVRRGQLVWR